MGIQKWTDTDGDGTASAVFYGSISDIVPANANIVTLSSGGAAAQTAALTPIAYPIVGRGQATITALAFCVTTLEGSSTLGGAIYQMTYTSAGTYSGAIVAQLNAAAPGTAAAVVFADLTPGTATSGAAPITLDFENNRYCIAQMVSGVGTMQTISTSYTASKVGLGIMKAGSTKASTTGWDGTINQTSYVALAGANRVPWVGLVTATGKILP